MGGDLFDYIGERGGRLPEREAAIIFRQVRGGRRRHSHPISRP